MQKQQQPTMAAPFARMAALNPYAAAALGADRAHQETNIADIGKSGGKQRVLTMRVVALSPQKEMAQGVRRLVALVPDWPGRNKTMEILKGGDIMYDGRVARIDRYYVIKSDEAKAEREAKEKSSNKKVAFPRRSAGTVDITLGSPISVILPPGITESGGISGIQPMHEYVLEVSEVKADVYEGVESTSFSVARITRGRHIYEFNGSEANTLLAAFYHAGQLNRAMSEMVVNSAKYTNMPAVDELKKFKAIDLAEQSRHMRSGDFLLPVMDGPSEVFTERLKRGLPACMIADVLMALDVDDNWPAAKVIEGNLKRFATIKLALKIEQWTPRNALIKPEQLPIPADQLSKYYDNRHLFVHITLWEEAINAFGVLDRRHCFSSDKCRTALRYLIAKTPFLGRFYTQLRTVSMRASPATATVTLEMSDSGIPKTQLPGGTVPDESTAVFAFLAHGVVNAGFPVSRARMLELMDQLGKREPTRYGRAMHTKIQGRKQPDGTKMPGNWLNTTQNAPVCNILESLLDLDNSLPEDEWAYYVIPNVGPKRSASTDIHGQVTAESPSLAFYRALLAERGEQAAADVMGSVFLQLDAKGEVQEPAVADRIFRLQNTSFDFLLFGVSRAYMREAKLSPLTTLNHTDAILPEYFERFYPSDLSDVLASVAPPPPPPAIDNNKNNKRADGAASSGTAKRAHTDMVAGDSAIDDGDDEALLACAERMEAAAAAAAAAASASGMAVDDGAGRSDEEEDGGGGDDGANLL